MRAVALLFCSFTVFPALAENSHAPLRFNGVGLGASASSLNEKSRRGACSEAKELLSECTIVDAYGIEYYVNEGRVVQVDVKENSSVESGLPYGLRLGMGLGETLQRSFSSGGAQAFVEAGRVGLLVVKLVREPGVDYEFELRMRFDASGRLEIVTYKDVM